MTPEIKDEIIVIVTSIVSPSHITSQFTGGKKHSEERTALFTVRVKLPCYVFHAFSSLLAGNPEDKSCCSTSVRSSLDFAANRKRACES